MTPHLEVSGANAYRFSEKVMFRSIKRRGGLFYTGIENIPDESRPYIVASKHRSWRDIITIGHIWLNERHTSVHFLTAKDMLEVPKVRFSGLGWFLQSKLGAFAVDRDSGTLPIASLNHIEQITSQKAVLGIFPEGDCVEWDDIRQHSLKRSVAALAVKYGLDIVPVGIAGSDTQTSGPVSAHVGEIVQVEKAQVNMNDPRSIVTASKVVMPGLYDQLGNAQLIARKNHQELLRV